MEHSSNYNKVKRYFVLGVWNAGRVRDAVEKGWINHSRVRRNHQGPRTNECFGKQSQGVQVRSYNIFNRITRHAYRFDAKRIWD